LFVRGREALEKRNQQAKEIKENGRGGLWGLIFFHNRKLSSFGGT